MTEEERRERLHAMGFLILTQANDELERSIYVREDEIEHMIECEGYTRIDLKDARLYVKETPTEIADEMIAVNEAEHRELRRRFGKGSGNESTV